MVVRLIFLSIFCRSFLQLVLAEINENCLCTTPQYLEYGKKGTIMCNVLSGFSDVYWYNTTDTRSNLPVISWNKELGQKIGDGYSRRAYDIQPDGSLVINDTILQSDGYFKVVILSNDVIVCEQTVHIIVLAKSKQSYPVIDQCGSKTYCYKRFDNESPIQLSCHLNGTGMFGSILWELLTSGEPQTIQTNTFLANTVDDRTNISIILPFSGQRLEVLRCKIATTHLYENKSSMILIERTSNHSDTQVTSIKPIIREAEIKSPLRLECGKGKRLSFVWKKCHSENKDGCVEIVHFSLENKVILVNGYDADSSGALFVDEVKALHESWYWYLSSDGRQNTEKIYQVHVYVLPVPPKLIVEECDGDNLCNVKSRREGNLTCSLFGIRPEARLEWAVLSMHLLEMISFSERETKVISHDDVYDITIRTFYVVKNFKYSKIDLECRATVNINNISNLFTTVQLHLSDGDTSSDTNHKTPLGVDALSVLIVLNFVVLFCFIIYIIKGHCKRRRSFSSEVEKGVRLNVQQSTNKRENLEEDFRIRLSTLKVNIAKNLGHDDALHLGLLLNMTQKENITLTCSKNPAIELIDVLLEGDEKVVMYNLYELERVSKQSGMKEVNELSNNFMRDYFRESFLLKIGIMKNGNAVNEAESLLSKLLWDYSQRKTISELDSFFQENYDTTISSVQDGSLVVRVNVPPTKRLKNLCTDIHSGKLVKRIFPILNNSMKIDYNHGNSLDLSIACDKNVTRRLQKMLATRVYKEAEKGKYAHEQYENSKDLIRKDGALGSPKTVLMGKIATVCLQMAKNVGKTDASDLCKYFKLSPTKSKQLLSSPNPGLGVILFLITKNENSVEEILTDFIEATYELSWPEVRYILHNFETQICESRVAASDLENGVISENYPEHVIVKQWWHSLMVAISEYMKWGGSIANVLPCKEGQKTRPIPKESYELKRDKSEGTLDKDKPGGSEFDLQSLHELFYKIACRMMKIVEYQSSFRKNGVSIFNSAAKYCDELKRNINVHVTMTTLIQAITGIETMFGLLLYKFGFISVACKLVAVDLVLEFAARLFKDNRFHVKGISAQ